MPLTLTTTTDHWPLTTVMLLGSDSHWPLSTAMLLVSDSYWPLLTTDHCDVVSQWQLLTTDHCDVVRQWQPGSSTTRHGWARVDNTRLWNTNRQSQFILTAVSLTTDLAGSSTTNLSSLQRSLWDKWLRLRTHGCLKSLLIITKLKNWTTELDTRCLNAQARQGKILTQNSGTTRPLANWGVNWGVIGEVCVRRKDIRPKQLWIDEKTTG